MKHAPAHTVLSVYLCQDILYRIHCVDIHSVGESNEKKPISFRFSTRTVRHSRAARLCCSDLIQKDIEVL